MNVSEATATNLLLGAVLGMSAVGTVPVSHEDAERAAQFLGNRASTALDGKRRQPVFDDVVVTSGVL